MPKQESMTSDERSDLRPGRMPSDGQPEGNGKAKGNRKPEGPGGTPGVRGRGRSAAAAVLAVTTRSRGRRLTLMAIAAVAAVTAAIVAIGGTSSGTVKPHSNPPAPAFTLPILGHPGQHISLAAFAGRPVILNFFASWCEPCQKETPLLARYYRNARGTITLIGVDVNDKASAAQKFTRAAGVSYPVAFDPYPMPATISYGVGGLPQTFFLDARHRIVKRVFGAVTEQELTSGAALITTQAKRG